MNKGFLILFFGGMNMRNKTKVLAICEALIPSAIIGVLAVLNHLRLKGDIDLKYLNTSQVRKEHVDPIDVLICIRGNKQKELQIVDYCKKNNKYVLYFLDDDFLGITPNAGELYKYFNENKVRKRLCSIMKSSDCLWTPSDNIRKKYGYLFNKSLCTDAPALLLDKNRSINCNRCDPCNCCINRITIGFAGSLFYGDYIDRFLKEPIKKITKKYGNRVQFEIFGPKPPGVSKFGIHYIPPTQSFSEYARIMKSRKWDIAFSALEPSEFNSCKYYIKYLDYAAIGAAGIYTCTEPYTNIIENKKNGLLVSNTIENWTNAFEYLIQNTEKRLNIQKEAYAQIKTKFNIDYISNTIIKSIPQIVQYKAACNTCSF